MKKITARFLRYFKTTKGFTLVELLVVIGILGILAAGLLAVVDPLEQFRKGQDSNAKTTSLELVNALTRYYATHNAFPWDTTANGGAACNGGAAPTAVEVSSVNATSAFNDCLTTLQSQGELKTTFSSQYSILNQLYVTDTTVSGQRYAAVCFLPASKSERARSTETKYTASATPVADLSTCGATSTACYWCAQ